MQDFFKLFLILAAVFTALGVVMITGLHLSANAAARWHQRRLHRRWPALAQMSDEEWLARIAAPPPSFEEPIFEDESPEQPSLFDQDATAVLDVELSDDDVL